MAVPLRKDDRELLGELPAMGEMVGTTGKACVSCAWQGGMEQVVPLGRGWALFSEGGGLGWIEGTWRHTLAVLSKEHPAWRPSLMLFGESGEFVQRFLFTEPEAWKRFQSLVERHRGCPNCLRCVEVEAPGCPPFDCPGSLLREAWRGACSRRDRDLRLAGIGVDRLQAVRAMEGLYTASISLSGFLEMLECMANSRSCFHFEVGNRHCAQILEGPLVILEARNPAWCLGASGAEIQFQPEFAQSVWGVIQPGSGGERFWIEVYDLLGDRVLSLTCPRGADLQAVRTWERVQALLESDGMGADC